jgi:peptidoglycan/xylan/chitin deacetylase (PgdA/CDA1 family)
VALSADDAPVFDWFDMDYPGLGPQRGFRSILQAHQRVSGRSMHLTSFAIASPEARAALDRQCLHGQDWMRHDWWPEAASSDLIAIENHSWDHNHSAIARSAQRDNVRGTFRNIETLAEAEAEIRQASDWLDALCPQGPRRSLFAYPYGEFNDYLAGEYLPHHQTEHRLRAAFTVEAKPISRGDSPWLLGRYVAGFHWRDPGRLESLLREALGLAPA